MKTLFPILGLLALVQTQALADEQGQYVKAVPKAPRLSQPFSVNDIYTRDMTAVELDQFLKQKLADQAKAKLALQQQKLDFDEGLATWARHPDYAQKKTEHDQNLKRIQETMDQMDAVNLNLMQKIIAQDPKSPYTKNKLVVAAKKRDDDQDAKTKTAEEKAALAEERAFKRDSRYQLLLHKLSKAEASLALERKAASTQAAGLSRKLKVCQANAVNVSSPVPQSVQTMSDSVLNNELSTLDTSKISDAPGGAVVEKQKGQITSDPNQPLPYIVPSVIPTAIPAK